MNEGDQSSIPLTAKERVKTLLMKLTLFRSSKMFYSYYLLFTQILPNVMIEIHEKNYNRLTND